MKLIEHYNLSDLTTFGTEAMADFFVSIDSLQDVHELVNVQKDYHLLVLGGGSNLLFTQDFHGCVIKNNIKGIEKIAEDDEHVCLKIGAGEIWDELVAYCVKKGWAGVENLSLIPGTVGAAPIQNIGAYGVELKEVFECLEAVNLFTGETKIYQKSDCEFGYRQSVFKKEAFKGQYIITHVTLKLNKRPSFKTTYGAIQQKLDEKGITELSIAAIRSVVCEIRQSKLPDPAKIGNAGSFFKNPELSLEAFEHLKQIAPDVPNYPVNPTTVKVPAGWLIEQCGWKGKTFGSYGVYDKQALVLVSYGEKEGEKIKKLAYDIKKSVWDRFSVHIAPEVNIL